MDKTSNMLHIVSYDHESSFHKNPGPTTDEEDHNKTN